MDTWTRNYIIAKRKLKIASENCAKIVTKYDNNEEVHIVEIDYEISDFQHKLDIYREKEKLLEDAIEETEAEMDVRLMSSWEVMMCAMENGFFTLKEIRDGRRPRQLTLQALDKMLEPGFRQPSSSNDLTHTGHIETVDQCNTNECIDVDEHAPCKRVQLQNVHHAECDHRSSTSTQCQPEQCREDQSDPDVSINTLMPFITGELNNANTTVTFETVQGRPFINSATVRKDNMFRYVVSGSVNTPLQDRISALHLGIIYVLLCPTPVPPDICRVYNQLDQFNY